MTITGNQSRLLFALTSEKEMDTYLESNHAKAIIADIKSLIDTSHIRQLALKDFMCAFLSGHYKGEDLKYIHDKKEAEAIAQTCDLWVTAYIKQLNKQP